MKIVFLGTTSMIPTKERNHSAILLRYRNENILIDCGEGTQRQLRICGFQPPRLTRILLTHWHGDHFFGLPGIIDNLARHNFAGTLYVHGPKGTKKYFEKMLDAFTLRNKIPISFTEIKKDSVFYENDDFALEAAYLKHSIPCIGYRFREKDARKVNMDYVKKFGLQEGPIIRNLQRGKDITFAGKKIRAKNATYLKKGKHVSFVLDTTLCPACYWLGKDADVLVCESTYCEDKKDKARAYMHLTSRQAASIAKKAKAKQLILTHFSQRYDSMECFEREAKSVFKNTILAKDFFECTI